MTVKERKDQLMKWANEAIRDSSICNDGVIVSESYNGQIAAFSVSVAISGLKPAMALYYSGKGSSDVDKKKIIGLIADMYSKDTNTTISADEFYKKVIEKENSQLPELQKQITEYGIALKLAIRTFKFKQHE